MNNYYHPFQCPYFNNTMMNNPAFPNQLPNQMPYMENPWEPVTADLKDYGPEPLVINIEKATIQNNNFRTVLWTGKHLQLTLMSLKPGEDIGLEIHPNVDQFIRIEEGQGLVKMGNSKNNLDFQRYIHDGYAVIIPAGNWHNLFNTGCTPLKLYSIYAPPQHPHGTIHETKAAAQAAEISHSR